MVDKHKPTDSSRDDRKHDGEALTAGQAVTLVDGLTHAGENAPGTGLIDHQATIQSIEAVASVLEKQEHLEERPGGVTPGDRPDRKRK